MNEDGNTRGSRRYVALDIHKHYCVIAGVDREGRVVLQPVRVEHADLEGWLKKNLRATDHVVIESTTNAWHVYDLLEPLVERVVVANPIQGEADRQCAGEDRYPRYAHSGQAAGSQSGSGCVGAACCMFARCVNCCRSAGNWWRPIPQIVNRMHSVAHRHHLKHERGKRFNEKNTVWQKDKRSVQDRAVPVGTGDGEPGLHREAD